MGTGMASRIQKTLSESSSQPLRVYNRTASRCAPLEELGAERRDTVGQLTQDCDIIFLSSSADSAIISIVDQVIVSGSIKGKIVVDTTTVHPDTSKAVSAKLSAHEAHFAAMPVFGASPAAAAGTVLAAFAGPEVVLKTVSPLLKGVLAREVLVVGLEPEKALLLKTTGNLLMASLMQIIAEAHVFASKTGLPEATLERLLELNFGTVAHTDSIRMTTGVYCPGEGQAPWSDLDLAIKDVGHAIEIAEREGVSLRAGQVAYEGLGKAKVWANSEGKANSGGQAKRLDSTSLFGVAREESGLDFKSDFVKERDGKGQKPSDST
ncbi:3-hydroxyisobutyrate dehydrogenase, mitochondrial 1 [Seiridium cupressi]